MTLLTEVTAWRRPADSNNGELLRGRQPRGLVDELSSSGRRSLRRH